jgi:hypothetical protein
MSMYSPVSSLFIIGYICNTWIYEIVTRHPKKITLHKINRYTAPQRSVFRMALWGRRSCSKVWGRMLPKH